MLELIFQGLIEWIYGLILEAWEYFASSLLDLMSMDFAYLSERIAIIPTIRQAMLAIGWALLLGNLVFQAAKSMLSGLGFEGEDPKLLFTRTFVFAFLLLASPQICDLGLAMTEKMIEVLRMPTAVHISLADESAFVGLSGAWLLVAICGIIVMFKSFKLIIEMAERYFILSMLTISAPLAFGTGGSRNTSDIFNGWCRMYGSMCILMVLNVAFIKMLLSILSYVPSGLDVLPWMILVLTVVKVAKKADAIITRIGLNPAMTGDSLGRSFPGMLTYMVARTLVSNAARSFGGGGKNGSAGNKNPNTPPGGSGAGGSNPHIGNSRSGAANDPARQGGSFSHRSASQANTQQSTSQQESQNQNTAAQYGGQQSSASEQQSTANHVAGSQVIAGGADRATGGRTRSTAVPAGMHRSPSHMEPPPGSASGRNNAASPAQASSHPAETGGVNTQYGIAGTRVVNPSSAAGSSASNTPRGTAGKNAVSTHRESTIREAAASSGMAGTERTAVPPVTPVIGTKAPTPDSGTAGTEGTATPPATPVIGMKAPMPDSGTAGTTYGAGRGQNAQPRAENSFRSGMAGNAHLAGGRTGVTGKPVTTPAPNGNTSGSGDKSPKTSPSVQANTPQNGKAGMFNGDVGRVSAAGEAAHTPVTRDTAKTGGNSRQRSSEVGQTIQSRNGMAGMANAQTGSSGSGFRTGAVPFGTAGNSRPGTGGSPRSETPGQPSVGMSSKSESGVRNAAPVEGNRSYGTAGSRQGPVNNTILSREQNHISVNQNTTGASAPGDTVISPAPGNSAKEQPGMGSTRSTHRPQTDKPMQRPGTAAPAARSTNAVSGKQTPEPGHGTAGNAAAASKAIERSTNATGEKRPVSPTESTRTAGQVPKTVRQENAGASADTRSRGREKPVFKQNEATAPEHGGPAAVLRNGMAGKRTPEKAAPQDAAARQMSKARSTRSTSLTRVSEQTGGKKTASKATGTSQRFSGKVQRKTKRKARKAGGKKRGKQ